MKTFEINRALFVFFVDVEECELYLYLGSQTDVLDGTEIAVTVHNDNAPTYDEIVDV